MPATRRILKHVRVEVAKARRKCHRKPKEHSIAKHESFLRIQEEGQGGKNYCSICATAILDQAEADLAEVTAGLDQT